MLNKEIKLSRKALAVLVAFLVFQLVFFQIGKYSFGMIFIPMFGTVAFFITFLTATIFSLISFKPNLKEKSYRYALFALFIALLSGVSSIFRASFVDRFLLSGLSTAWWFISFYLFNLKSPRFGAFGEVVALPFIILDLFVNSGRTFIEKLSSFSFTGSRHKTNASKFIVGLAITAPVSVFLLILLSSADPIFGHFVEKIFSFDISISELFAQMLWRTFFSVIALVILILFALTRARKDFSSPLAQLDKRSSALLSPFLMLTVTVSAILIAFLLVQFRYIFQIASLEDLKAFGILTFSEYVKKGFGELLFVTAVIYAISGAGLVLYRAFKPSKIYFYANSFLILLNLMLAASVFRRVSLYVSEHGLTRMRIYGSMVLLIIVVFLVTLFMRYLLRKHSLYLIELLAASFLIFTFSSGNVDNLIATVSPPTVNGTVDMNYLASLSPDAYRVWQKIADQAKLEIPALVNKENLTKEEKIKLVRYSWALDEMYWKISNLSRQYGTDKEQYALTETALANDYRTLPFFNLNFGELQAYDYLRKNTSFEESAVLRKSMEAKLREISIEGVPEEAYENGYGQMVW